MFLITTVQYNFKFNCNLIFNQFFLLLFFEYSEGLDKICHTLCARIKLLQNKQRRKNSNARHSHFVYKLTVA